jgi:hypothetical protein
VLTHESRRLPSWLIFDDRRKKMLLPRERFQIGFVTLGLFLVGFGIALAQPGARVDERLHHNPQRVGFWKDFGISVDAGRNIAPWMIASGAAAFGAAYVCRQR